MKRRKIKVFLVYHIIDKVAKTPYTLTTLFKGKETVIYALILIAMAFAITSITLGILLQSAKTAIQKAKTIIRARNEEITKLRSGEDTDASAWERLSHASEQEMTSWHLILVKCGDFTTMAVYPVGRNPKDPSISGYFRRLKEAVVVKGGAKLIHASPIPMGRHSSLPAEGPLMMVALSQLASSVENTPYMGIIPQVDPEVLREILPAKVRVLARDAMASRETIAGMSDAMFAELARATLIPASGGKPDRPVILPFSKKK